MRRPTVAYVVDPRFPGGTSAAVAQELRAVAGRVQPRLALIEGAMFRGREIAPALAAAIEDLGLETDWNPPQICADVVIVHNPVFLKFNRTLASRIVARRLIVVMHENPLRPGGAEAFDAGHCLGQIEAASLCIERHLAPVSRWNRRTVTDWLAGPGAAPRRRGRWQVLAQNWFNICDLPLTPPTPTPRDRRGRHSRPGFEKFPPLPVMDACFPAHAGANMILGADLYMAEGIDRPHWQMLAFGSVPVADFLACIDFQIHFTAPTWRESFGRVLAEGIAAGKVAIADPDTAATFEGGVIGARADEVDAIVARFVADPAAYAAQVARGQAWLEGRSAARFDATFADILVPREVRAA